MQGSLALTAMRNEGPFILEWVAWQKMLGFENILILHNDCTDHSPQLLRLLDRTGEVSAKRHEPREGHSPQTEAYRTARRNRLVKQAEWMFTSDVDEFLVIHKGDGSIGALLNNDDVPFAAMAINWRLFGSAGHRRWQDDLVHRRYFLSSKPGFKRNSVIKSFVRHPRLYNRLNSHCASGWRGKGAWGQDGNYWALSDGSRFDEFHPNKHPQNAVPDDRKLHHIAEVHHYAVRSHEEFSFKKGRPAASDFADRYTDTFRKTLDRNEVENLAVSAYRKRFDTEYDRLCQIPGVMRLHHLCCADYVAEICTKRGDDPAADERYLFHKEMAQKLPRH
ncbi:glycosyltransferase family 2 protein [Profundibacter sp.]